MSPRMTVEVISGDKRSATLEFFQGERITVTRHNIKVTGAGSATKEHVITVSGGVEEELRTSSSGNGDNEPQGSPTAGDADTPLIEWLPVHQKVVLTDSKDTWYQSYHPS